MLILGGGVGGVVAANVLRRRLDRRHRIVVVDREPYECPAAHAQAEAVARKKCGERGGQGADGAVRRTRRVLHRER